MEEVEKTNESPASDKSDWSRHCSHGCSNCRRRRPDPEEDCTSSDGNRMFAMYCVHVEYMEVNHDVGRGQSQRATYSLIHFNLAHLFRCEALYGRSRPPG